MALVQALAALTLTLAPATTSSQPAVTAAWNAPGAARCTLTVDGLLAPTPVAASGATLLAAAADTTYRASLTCDGVSTEATATSASALARPWITGPSIALDRPHGTVRPPRRLVLPRKR